VKAKNPIHLASRFIALESSSLDFELIALLFD